MIESQTGRHLQTSGLKCLVRDTSGTVALLTGLAAIPIFAFMGLAVDYALM